MRILMEKYSEIHYQTKEKLDDGDMAWATVATLYQSFDDILSYELYFYKYGKENGESYNDYECYAVLKKGQYETQHHFLERVSWIVKAKMLEMANNIIKELNEIEFVKRG